MNFDAALLFQPFRLGDLDLPNRIVMAPLTRNRATHGRGRRQRPDRRLLPSTRRRRADRFRGLADQPAGARLHLDARPLQRGPGRGLAARRRARCTTRADAFSCRCGTSAASRTPPCSRTAARRSPLRRSAPRPGRSSRRGSPTFPSRARLQRPRSPGSSRTTRAPRPTPSAPASTASKSTPPTAT